MKKIIYFLVFTVTLTASCKKDYPDDIPDWVKEKIREYKKEEGQGELSGDPSIIESNCNGEIIYSISIRYPHPEWKRMTHYDYNGNELCYENCTVGYYGNSCNNKIVLLDCWVPSSPPVNCEIRRRIWSSMILP